MRVTRAILFALLLALTSVLRAQAQEANTIWIETSLQDYVVGETVSVTLYGISATPIQGFTFQLHYDPACLKPTVPSSAIAGFNYLPLPQVDGTLDATFASSSPQSVAGLLSEIQFTTLKDCQTAITLAAASLATLNSSGIAVPLEGISLGNNSVSLTVTQPKGATPIPLPSAEVTALPAETAVPADSTGLPSLSWPILLLVGLLGVAVIAVIFMLSKEWRNTSLPTSELPRVEEIPILYVKRGAQAGQKLYINRLPCHIGKDANNEIRLDDPHISARHVQIVAIKESYGILDLGSEEGTFVNGKAVHHQPVILKSGDVVRLGGVLLVFGT